MKHLLLINLLLFAWFAPSFAQQAKLNRIERDARNTMKYKEYSTAITLWEELRKTDENNLEYNYQLGVCYLHSNAKNLAQEYLQKVYDQNKDYNDDIEYMLGQAHHYQSNYSKAKEHYVAAKEDYEAMKSRVAGSDLKQKEKDAKIAYANQQILNTEKRLREVENGLKYADAPVNASIENIGQGINSEYGDYTPILPKDQDFMIFTSRREGTTGEEKDWGDDMYFEDIYLARKSNDKWGSPQQLKINHKYHDAAAALSADGKTMYLYRDDRKTKGDLYTSEYNEAEDTWSEPEKLNDNINTKHQETSVSISADGNTLYFASDRPGGYGGLDIYKSEKGPDGEWGAPQNLGEPINTAYDDDAPFISFDGEMLYFSSRGHDSMGGYDIFKSKANGDKWEEPINLGHPVNGPEDDAHLVLSPDNKIGYFVSADDAGYGDKDIYILAAPKVTLKPLDKTGLTITKPSDFDTTATAEKPDFFFQVLFDFDQSRLRPKSVESAENLLKYLNDNPDVRIELSGHTCNIGSLAYNKALSTRRARAVANYLIERGIDANRIEVQGYSFERPSVPNNSPSNRALNRRTEFSVLDE